ncbi:MAG: hypothetical protein LBC56_00510 [Oscillospiraceae bacterium]|nr:hypothetical protein [Oscillospiraceae bacterium]
MDIPLKSESAAVDTLEKAVQWKKQNGYTAESCKACWPMVKDNLGRVYHMSALTAWLMMRTDFSHDGIPFEMPANKEIPAINMFFGETSKNRGYDQQSAHDMTAQGITTAFSAGRGLLPSRRRLKRRFLNWLIRTQVLILSSARQVPGRL